MSQVSIEYLMNVNFIIKSKKEYMLIEHLNLIWSHIN